MKNKLSLKQRLNACIAFFVRGTPPFWWWENLSDAFYESRISHKYKDGGFDYSEIRMWFLSHSRREINK